MINYYVWLLGIGYYTLVIDHWLLDYELLIIGYWLLVIGYQLLVIGDWVIGYWLLFYCKCLNPLQADADSNNLYVNIHVCLVA